MQGVHRSICNKPGPASGSKDGPVVAAALVPVGAGGRVSRRAGRKVGVCGSVQRAAVLLLKGHLAQELAVQLYPTHR